MSDIKGTINDFNKTIFIKPDYIDAYNNKGVLMCSINKLDEGIINFIKAIEINPKYLDAYFNRNRAKYY